MKINDYFIGYCPNMDEQNDAKLSSFVDFYSDSEELDLSSYNIIIIGVQEGRLSLRNKTCAFAPDEIRAELYELYKGDWTASILDFGNLKIGPDVMNTYLALNEVIQFLLKKKKLILVLGGGHDLITPIYNGHSSLGKPLSFASADAYLDFQDGESYHSKSFLSQLISSSCSLLSKYTLFGYQGYLCSTTEVDFLRNLDFNLLRLGELNADIPEMEPYIRDLDHLSIDLSVVKSSDAPATVDSSPNGITAETLCTLLRYAGMSHGIKSILFSELNPRLDKSQQSSKTFAQSIWHFIEGFHLRNDDFPEISSNNFKKFHVSAGLLDLVFYKSSLTNRWWVELIRTKQNPAISLLSCSVNDYNKAAEGFLSDRLLSHLKL